MQITECRTNNESESDIFVLTQFTTKILISSKCHRAEMFIKFESKRKAVNFFFFLVLPTLFD